LEQIEEEDSRPTPRLKLFSIAVFHPLGASVTNEGPAHTVEVLKTVMDKSDAATSDTSRFVMLAHMFCLVSTTPIPPPGHI
jgi:hypothetical protein